MNWKVGGRRHETMATRDSDERRLRQRIGVNDCGGLRRLSWTAMATDDDGVDPRRHERAGGGRRWERNETPTRDYGDKRQQLETAETADW